MKLAFSTLGCPAWPFDKIVAYATQTGYDAIEIRGVRDEMRCDRLPAFLPENRSATRRMLQDAGLFIAALDTSAAFDRGYERQSVMDEGKRALEICNDMGIPFIRVFGNRIAPDEDENEALRRASDGVAALCEYAGDARVLLETHGDFVRTAQFARVMEALDNDRAGILWDVAHTVDDNFFQQCGRWVRHVHIKDRLGGQLCLVGEGELPLDNIWRALKEGGYAGVISLEWEKRWHPELAGPETAFGEFFQWAKRRG